jgi:hypothetical protein
VISIAATGYPSGFPFAGGIGPLANAAVGATQPAKLTVIGRHSRLTMRWLIHVLARLAITASCTCPAAALDARVEPANILPLQAACRRI